MMDLTFIFEGTQSSYMYFNEINISAKLVEGADLDVKDCRGDTPLHYAVKEGERSLADLFLNRGANVNCRNKEGNTPLHEAVMKQDIDSVELLILYKCNVNLQNNSGSTPLHIAIKTNVESIVKRLVCAAADINVKNNYCRTSLHLAVELNADVSIISYLLDNYLFDKELEINKSNIMHETPLFPALNHPSSELVTKMLLDKGFEANVKDFRRMSPLHLLCNDTKKETVELLLDNGHEIDVKNRNGFTPLFLAVKCNNISVVDLLLNRGADVNTQDNMDFLSPLHLASCTKNVELVERLLLEETLNIDLTTYRGHTAIHQAVVYNNIPVVDLLLRKGCNVNLQDNNGHSPLFMATMHAHLQLLKTLLDKNICDIDQKDMEGNTPLSKAVKEDNKHVINLLLRYGASVNVQDSAGKTPLHRAVEHGSMNSIKLLLESGASVDVFDNSGKIPLDLVTYNQKEIVEIFEEIEKLKGKRLNGVPLYRLISNRQNPIFIFNSEMENFINSGYLEIEFPIYSATLKQFFNLAKERNGLLNSISFNIRVSEGDELREIQLPNELSREILCYLTNKDLKHFKHAFSED